MTRRELQERPWSVPMPITEVPETGRQVDLEPDTATREALARMAGLVALPRLRAVFDLARHGSGGLRVVGRVSATVEQACVVSLDPVFNEIEEAVDLVFSPAITADAAGRQVAIQNIDAEEPPEALQDGIVDLGVVATEFLILGIDPYPRKPGAVFAAPQADEPVAHPFAALAALKKGHGGRDV
jgi:uncharacterized metal-binding protein YceD (DUF177 family)